MNKQVLIACLFNFKTERGVFLDNNPNDNPNKKPKQDPNNQGKNNNENNLFKFLIIALLLTFVVNSIISSLNSDHSNYIRYDEFIQKLENGEIKKVDLMTDRLKIELYTEELNGTSEIATSEEDSKVETEESTDLENQDALGEEAETVENSSTDEANGLFGSLFNPFSNPLSENSEMMLVEEVPLYLYTGRILEDTELINRLDEAGVEFNKEIIDVNPILDFFTQWIIPMLLFYGIIILMFTFAAKKMGGRGGFMNVGKSNAKRYIEEKTGITFNDVAGQEEAKDSLEEIVDYLHYPKKYVAIGAKQPTGALLVGPPGTGKTLLAKAVAGEASVPFFSLSGSDFVEMFVGVGASRVRDLFKEAKAHAPCIIFIDEIDAIGKSRDSQIGGNDEREQTLNQLLSEMDGFDTSNGVVILAATNRPEILDKALLRPGRFDRQITVEKPDLKGRIAILEVHIKKVKISSSIKLKDVAMATAGAVGADLANMVNEAALRAVRMGRKQVIQEDLMEAVELVIAGKEKKDRILSEKEKKIVAFHEIGHALVSALQKNTEPVQKITIVPRTNGALGYVMQVPEEEKYLMSKNEILDQITVALAGRCAEIIEFDTETTGAANDIEKATAYARNMVTMYGMSEEFGMMMLEKPNSQYLGTSKSLLISEVTEADVDKVVKKIIDDCFAKAMNILKENHDTLIRLSGYLIEKETITGSTFMKLLNNEEIIDVDEIENITLDEYLDNQNKENEPIDDTEEDVTLDKNDGFGSNLFDAKGKD